MFRLDLLLENLIEQVKSEDNWQLSFTDLLDYTDYDLAALYRAVYQCRDNLDFGMVLDGFSMRNIGVLLTFLEKLGVVNPEERFTRAGLFIPYSLGIDFNAVVVQYIHDQSLIHELDEESFAAMLWHTGDPVRGIEIYHKEYFPLEEVLEQAVFYFMELKQVEEWAFPVYMGFCQMLLERKILLPHQLYMKLDRRLSVLAQEWGYISAGDDKEGVFDEIPGELREALDLFNLSHWPVTREKIRSRYKELMKMYHPDINPRGLRHSQEINSAYALLLTRL